MNPLDYRPDVGDRRRNRPDQGGIPVEEDMPKC